MSNDDFIQNPKPDQAQEPAGADTPKWVATGQELVNVMGDEINSLPEISDAFYELMELDRAVFQRLNPEQLEGGELYEEPTPESIQQAIDKFLAMSSAADLITEAKAAAKEYAAKHHPRDLDGLMMRSFDRFWATCLDEQDKAHAGHLEG